MDHEVPTSETHKAIATFVVVAFCLSGILALIIGLTGGYRSPLIGLQFLSMFIPALAVVVVSLLFGPVRTDWRRLPWRYVPLALLILPVVMHVVMLPVIMAYEGGIPWQEWLTPQADGLIHSSAERGWGVMTTGGLVRRVVLNAVVGVTIVSILAVFEEVGWRAWLLPRLMQGVSGPRASCSRRRFGPSGTSRFSCPGCNISMASRRSCSR